MTAVGHHHQVGNEYLAAGIHCVFGRTGPELDAGDACPSQRSDEACHIGHLTDVDVGQRDDSSVDDPVEQATAAGKRPEVPRKPDIGMPSIPSLLAMPKAQDLFDEQDQLTADWVGRQAGRFLDELEWYGTALMTARRGGVPY